MCFPVSPVPGQVNNWICHTGNKAPPTVTPSSCACGDVRAEEGRAGGSTVTDLAENPTESQSDPRIPRMGTLRPREGTGLVLSPQGSLGYHGCSKAPITVYGAGKFFIAIQRSCLIQASHPGLAQRRPVKPFKTAPGTGILNTVKCNCFCQPEGL